MVTVWWSAASLIHYSFWILVKPLHLRNMLSKLMRCTKNCNSAAGIGQQEGPNSPWQCLIAYHTTNASEVEWIGLWSLALSAIFTWPLANWLPLLQASQQLFAGKTLPQPAGCRKCWEFIKSQSMGFWFLFFTARISKFISTWQSCVDCNSSYSD